MKDNPSIKHVKNETPKTPGGISKSLLTPCRRVGLSRNWKKAGPSPFISPLSGSSSNKVEAKPENKEPRKRKRRVESEEDEEDRCTPENVIENDNVVDTDERIIPKQTLEEKDELTSTPTRHIVAPCKKTSKTLLTAMNKNVQDKKPLRSDTIGIEHTKSDINISKDKNEHNITNKHENVVTVKPTQKSRSKDKKKNLKPEDTVTTNLDNTGNDLSTFQTKEEIKIVTEQVDCVTPLQKAKGKSKKNVSLISSPKNNRKTSKCDTSKNINNSDKQTVDEAKETKPRSPKELAKECIVVIQKKIFKTDKKKADPIIELIDSDSDEVPLGQLNKCHAKAEEPVCEKQQNVPTKIRKHDTDKISEVVRDDDDDFIKINQAKVRKLEDKATSIGGLKNNSKQIKPRLLKPLATKNDFDDDDDFESKKTILIRKTYDKVNKPLKAKSTGSITQSDIDELRKRIETKKKMLLACAMTEDTEELRGLIKKWKKGCQDALMELMDLMKTKFADKQNMDYSEMLTMLKIPPNLVGYDADNDCFTTPEDTNIILSKFNDS